VRELGLLRDGSLVAFAGGWRLRGADRFHTRGRFLSFGETVIPGATDREVLISTHVCHPSMCNDNLPEWASALTCPGHLASVGTRYTYRFVFVPGTIGAITWLTLSGGDLDRIGADLVRGPVPASRSADKQGKPARHVLIDRAAGWFFLPPSQTPRSRTSRRTERRTEVLLARFRFARRLPHSHSVREISRVPHIGR
jgi:Domain of unknown function (DUF4910)